MMGLFLCALAPIAFWPTCTSWPASSATARKIASNGGFSVPRLVVIKGTDEGKQFDIEGPRLEIGRDATNRIRLHDTEVSRRHAQLDEIGEGYTLRDIGSVNGTFLNNQKITKAATLKPGDRVQIGQTVLVYSAGRSDSQVTEANLAGQISMITGQTLDAPSAIVKSIGEGEATKLLSEPERAATPWLKTQLANLTIMYEASLAVSHILDLDQLLDRILELIFRSVKADRGCIMLRNPDSGQLEPRAIRWRGDRQERITVSRTVVDHVLRETQGVLVADASQDERFNTGQSIVRFGIREVICVPMKGRHETLGVLYLDTRTTARESAQRKSATGKFTEDHLRLAVAVGHQAALAVEETRYHRALLQAERLAAIGQTVAALSHDLKNILQGLRSGSEILKMGLAEKNDVLLQQGWKNIEKNQEKIYNLVMDMLSYSKEREPAVEETDLNEVVRDAVDLLAARAKELGVRLDTNLEEGLPPVQADPYGINRALVNVIGNALDAVEERKAPRVMVGTRKDPEAGWLRILVRDNGMGIPADRLADLFKPFVSTKGSRGTGLGLAVSKKTLREHGGDILVQSQPGTGSVFILRLPLKSPLALDLGGTTNPDMPAVPALPQGP
jgi:signal transduction histidine kinase/pSer/pThr/pTyr-binding forkhead associated (FHA) protein